MGCVENVCGRLHTAEFRWDTFFQALLGTVIPSSLSVGQCIIYCRTFTALSLQLCLSNSRYGMSWRDLSMISSSISC